MTFALSGSMVTFSVLATALFGAILTVRALGTSFLAVFADPAALARAMPVERIARGIVLTRAFVLAFATPQTHGTAYKNCFLCNISAFHISMKISIYVILETFQVCKCGKHD